MGGAESFYSPARLDLILSNWPAYESAAEHLRSSTPQAFRPSKRFGDAMAGADICADLSQAIVGALVVGSDERLSVDFRQQGWTFRAMAVELRLPRSTTYVQYLRALDKLALFLGYIDGA